MIVLTCIFAVLTFAAVAQKWRCGDLLYRLKGDARVDFLLSRPE